MNLTMVKETLRNNDEYSFNYRIMMPDTGLHYYQASFIRMYSYNSSESRIILGFMCIDSIMEEEHRNRAVREEHLRIISALSQEYSSLFKIDAGTGIMTLYRTDGKGFDPLQN